MPPTDPAQWRETPTVGTPARVRFRARCACVGEPRDCFHGETTVIRVLSNGRYLVQNRYRHIRLADPGELSFSRATSPIKKQGE